MNDSTPKKRGRPPKNPADTIKTPTLREKIEVYERLLHDIQFHREVTMNHAAVVALLDKIGRWSYSHRAGNGEYDEKQLQANIDHAFWNLDRR